MTATGQFVDDLSFSGRAVQGPIIVAPIGSLDGVLGLDFF